MAVFERNPNAPAGKSGVQAGEFVGRDLQMVTFVGSGALGSTGYDSHLERIVRSAQMYGTVTIVGVVNSATVTLVMEGLSNIATTAALSTAANAALAGHGTARTISSVTIAESVNGNAFGAAV